MNGGLPLFVGPGAGEGEGAATGAPAPDPAPNPVGAMPSGSVLLVTAVPLRRRAGRISLDDQTCDGLERWGQHFDRVVYAGIEEQPGREEGSSTTWREIRDLACADRITMVPLPNAYRVQDFSTHYGRTRALLGEMIGRSRYLCFTLGALVGDWGGVAALEAMAQRRDYAVWFDRVEHEVVRRTLGSMRLRRRVKEYVGLPLMVRYHRHLIRRSALGLFQGQDCFQAYAAHARRPFCVYDTHLMPEDMIGAADLAAKCAAIEGGDPLRLVYVGRASAMKGPFDWLDTVAGARRAGVRLTATWFGDGPLLEEMRAGIAARGLADCVTLAGFEGDRSRLLRAMRDAHLFLFCHTTPESPRCLLEALACGTPLVGYGSPYSEDIAGREGAGVLGPMRDPEALAQLVVGLDRRRAALADLVRAAARVGRRFDAAALYGRRADLLKRYL